MRILISHFLRMEYMMYIGKIPVQKSKDLSYLIL
jgi:hypothetical protein